MTIAPPFDASAASPLTASTLARSNTRLVGRYHLGRLLGRGASAAVYLAQDGLSGDQVAVKVLDAAPTNDAEAAMHAERFFHTESQLAGRLRHPHVVSILDAGISDGLRFVVMDYVEGSTLQDWCTPAHLLPVPRAVEILYKCCGALHHASQIGVVHRDIKPANILVTPGFDVKVSDFGAAMMLRGDTTQVSGVGSPAYMSPEQVRGDELSYHTDMFSLGATAYHVLTGRRPFDGISTYDLMEHIINQVVPLAGDLRPDVPDELNAIVRRAMAKRPQERFSTWGAMADALEDLLGLSQAVGDDLSEADKFSAMARLEFFRPFAAVELWEVVKLARWRRFAPGDNLITEGEHDQTFFIIADGLVKVSAQGQLLNAVGAGEPVGEMACARRNNDARTATVTALKETWAVGLLVDDLDRFSPACHARFSNAFLAIMAQRITMLSGRLLHTLQGQKIGMV